MRHALHLLIVDPQRGEALAAWHGGRWLLPIVLAPERARAAPAVEAWVAGRSQLRGRFIGQWLGRAERGSVDWLAVVCAQFSERCPDTLLRATPLLSLKNGSALVPYQRWAIRKTLSIAELPSTSGPFGTMTWQADVDAWLRAVVGDLARDTPQVVVHRATAYEAVLEYRTPRGRWFFKGLPRDRAGEPRLTAKLAALAPDLFPATILSAPRPNGSTWWLLAACGGMPLARCLSAGGASLAVREYGRIQQRATNAISIGRFGEAASLDLSIALDWARRLLDQVDVAGLPTRTLDVLHDACRRAATVDVPRSWIWPDFDPENVLVDDDRLRFIDLTDSLSGPAPIGAAVFLRRLARYGSAETSDIWDAYAGAWNPPLDLRTRQRAFAIVSTLLECQLDWHRVVRKTERGEVEGLVEPARRVVASRLMVAADCATRATIT